jgi:YHS domain-containing protein
MATEIKSGKPGATDLPDPVCGMLLNVQTAVKGTVEGKDYYFCSEECREKFESNPRAIAHWETD